MANITISQLSNGTSLNYYAQLVNTATNDIFWTVILIAIFIIILINSLKYGNDKAFLSSCFTTLIISILLFANSLISIVLPILFGLGTAGALLYIYYNNT